MYLRTTKRRNRDGATVSYYQLAHNTWDPQTKQASAKVVHNFGRADRLDLDELKRLCRSIARVCGLDVSDPSSPTDAGDTSGRADIMPKGVRQQLTRPLGTTWVISALWERLGIGPKLREVAGSSGGKAAYERALLAMTANRLCKPESKLGVWERWLETVYIEGTKGIKLEQMYEAMDLLYEHSAEVEEAVFFQVADLLNLEVDLVFFDTTTCSFAIDDPDVGEDDAPGLRQLGHSKEGTWTPQVVVALAVTRQGIPVRSWVFPGNTSDVTLVEKIRADLRGWKLGRTLFVADSGMNSQENREELARACGRYVLATRVGSVTEVRNEVLGRAGRYKVIDDNLRVKEVEVGEGVKRRRYIVCFNPRQAARQAHHRKQVLAELEAELESHPGRDANAKWAVKLRASRRYGRYLRVSKGGKLNVDRGAAKSAARLDGKWVLITNDDTLSVEDAATAYKGLLVIERCFRTLKTTQIRMGPMYHWLPRRIEAHVKLCVLALLIERVTVLASAQSWMRLHHELDKLQVTSFETDSHRFLRRNEVPPGAAQILQSLDIPVPKQVIAVEQLHEPA